MKSVFSKLHLKSLRYIGLLFFVMGITNIYLLDTGETPIELIEDRLTGKRGPASIQEDIPSLEVVSADCDLFDKEVYVKAHQVRIEGRVCKKYGESFVIQNTQNSIYPTVFRKENIFTTDLIHIKEGQNTFALILKDKNQKEIIKTLKIVR